MALPEKLKAAGTSAAVFFRYCSSLAVALIQFTACMVVAFSFLAFFGRFDWFLDVLSSFRLQYAVYLVFCSLFALRRGRLLCLFASGAVVNAAAIALLYFPDHARAEGSTRLKVMSMNLEAINNKNYALAVKCITGFNPDIISLQEIDRPFSDYLLCHLPEYKYSKLLPDKLCAGVGLLSKFPIGNISVQRFGLNFPMLSATVDTSLGPVNFLVVHPVPPCGGPCWSQQEVFARGIGQFLEKTHGKVILAGDLNATPWSYRFQKLKQCTRLLDSGQGFGLQPTWTTHCAALLIPIDHCFLSKDLSAVERKIGPDIHSDHYPLYLEIAKSGIHPETTLLPRHRFSTIAAE